jgi:hypothetical protein
VPGNVHMLASYNEKRKLPRRSKSSHLARRHSTRERSPLIATKKLKILYRVESQRLSRWKVSHADAGEDSPQCPSCCQFAIQLKLHQLLCSSMATGTIKRNSTRHRNGLSRHKISSQKQFFASALRHVLRRAQKKSCLDSLFCRPKSAIKLRGGSFSTGFNNHLTCKTRLKFN